jgi:methionine-rich copper-binding protein CopC
MRKIRIGGATVAALLLMAVLATTALAHAHYKSSIPGKGEVVAASPDRVSITFTQDIQKVAGTYDIQVNRDRGQSVASGPAVLDNTDRATMSVPLQPGLPQGRYVVNWKNVSDADGDPAEGAFSFYVKTQPNAVDIQNDQQLETIGAEAETPVSADTAAAGTAAPTTAAATATVAGTRTPASVTPASSDGGGNDSKVIYIVIGGIVAGIAIAVGGWFVFGRRGA